MFASVIGNARTIITTLAASLLLSACGGGGSSNASSPPPPPPPPPPPANQAPTADAGADQTVDEGIAVMLPGSGTDSDGMIASYAWTQDSGPTVTIVDADMQNASFTAPAVTMNEVLVFTLTVTDDDGATGTDTVEVTVQDVPAVNQPPTADAGPDQTVPENTAVMLDGSDSMDPDGTVDTYAWMQTGGTVVTLDDPSSATPSFTAPEVVTDEIFTFQLVVTDDAGAMDNDQVQVTVQNVNKAPVADAGPDQSVTELDTVMLDGTGSNDPDGTIDEYAWTQDSGTMVTLTGADTATPSFTAPDVPPAGDDLVFTLTVTDNEGLTGMASVTISVQHDNQLPTADAGPDQTASSLDPVTLDGSNSSDPDGTVDVYAWTQTAGTAVTLDDASIAMPSFTAPNVGADEILTFELIVTDNEGGVSPADSVNVTINPTLALPFSDDFSDGNADGWTVVNDNIETNGIWNVAAAAYVQSADTNQFGGDVTETYRRGTYSFLDNSVNLTDYRYSVQVTRLAASSDSIGIMFRYSDNDNYYRLEINSEAGYSRLESNVSGTFMTLARNYRGYLASQTFFDIDVEVEGALIQVFVNGDPLFAADNSDHAIGGIALYGRDGVRFDDVSIDVNSTSPEVVIASPVSHEVIPAATLPRDITTTAVARNVPAGGDVEFKVDFVAGSCNAATESSPGVFTALCPSVATGNRLIRAELRDAGLTVVDFDNNSDVAVSTTGLGDKYDAIGDSLTLGIEDNYRRDNLNLADQRSIAFQGWAGPLADALTTATGEFNLVANEGIPGDLSNETRFQRLDSIIERNPDSNRALIMIGTNDTNDFPNTPPATLIGHLENMANRLLNTAVGIRDRDNVYIASLPPIWGPTSSTIYADPLDPSATRNQRVIAYNNAIQTNVWENAPGIGVGDVILGPDFFSCFLTPTNNRFSLFADSLHPNGLGYAFMAALWEDVILNGAPTFPVDPCSSPIYIVEALDPYTHGHKQNLLEVGDEYYNDESFTVTRIPPELADGVWVTQSNADNGDTSADFLSFDAGSTAVTVYIAHDPSGFPPTSSTHTFSSVVLSDTLNVSDPAIGAGGLAIVSATGVTGTVTIGGTLSDPGAVGPQQAYVVIVVP